jgi:hypothetical protein
MMMNLKQSMNELQGKLQYLENIFPSATSSATNPIRPDLCMNVGCRSGKLATDHLIMARPYNPLLGFVFYCLVELLLQTVQTESSDEDSAEDQPLFSPDSAEKLPSQPSHPYVIQEKIEMVRVSKRRSECNY